MAKVFTAVIRARVEGAVVAELSVANSEDRLTVERFIESAEMDGSTNGARAFLKEFYGSDCLTTIEMKM